MIKTIDYFLNRITMYRLVLYYLIALIGIAAGLSAFGYLSYNPIALAFSAGYITIVCWVTNRIFSYVFEAPVNVESVYITALILALIVTPMKVPHDILFLTAVSGLAISSKFILAINKRHIFNPVAVAVALTAIGPAQTASWWVGNTHMLPFVVIGGLLVVRKIHSFRMVASFFVAVAVSTIVLSILTHHNIWSNLQNTALKSSLFFLAFVMLTEPLTAPATRIKKTWYGIIAGVLFPPQIHLLGLYSTPELSLLVANVFAYIVSPNVKLTPVLLQKNRIGPDIMDFVFQPERRISYKPGQFMEMTLPHSGSDARGNRRYFTLASSPTEDNLRFGIKFYPEGSSFKQAMLKMDSTSLVGAGHLAGSFVLPDDPAQKLVFIAGGIGVTPYRSMIKYLLDTNDKRTATLIYAERNAQELVYTDIFEQASRQIGLKTVYTLADTANIPAGWTGKSGNVSAEMIVSEVPDYKERLFYISGPPGMVSAIKKVLYELGVAHHQIKTDFFPGYV